MADSHVLEPSRRVPIHSAWDVVVCGAGPAGVSAAISAARSGARTALIEGQGCLGGVWTAGLLSWVIDASNKKGFMQELAGELDRRGARRVKGRSFAYDPEQMKVLLEQWCVAAEVAVRLHTRVVAAPVNEDGRLHAIITESRSGREAFAAKVFIDATGDGELGSLAGCGFDYGDPETGEVQPMTLVGLLTGIQLAEVSKFVGGGSPEAKRNLREEMERAGIRPSYGSPTLFCIREDLFAVSSTHEYGVSPFDADAVTEATLRSRAELYQQVLALRRLGQPWSDLRVVATGNQIGIREGRRIHGLYRVTLEDMLAGRTHPDAVCCCAFGVDVHSTSHSHGRSYRSDNNLKVRPYDIPLRALIARDVRGLMMAGRCISGDFLSHSSYRVTGNAVAMGEAAGRVAAAAAHQDVLPEQVCWESLHTEQANRPVRTPPLAIAS
jgi:hypothetical protein